MFTSDHGHQLWDHWTFGKGPYFDEGTRVPHIIRDPRRRADGTRGTRVARFTESVNIMPTVVELLDAEPPIQSDGPSLVPFLHGPDPLEWRTAVHWEIDFRDVHDARPEKARSAMSIGLL